MIDFTRMAVVLQKGHEGRGEMYVKYDVTDIPGYEWVWKSPPKRWFKRPPKTEPVIMTPVFFIDTMSPSTVADCIQQGMEDIQKDLETVARHLENPPVEPDCGFGEACVKQARMGTPVNEVPTHGGKY